MELDENGMLQEMQLLETTFEKLSRFLNEVDRKKKSRHVDLEDISEAFKSIVVFSNERFTRLLQLLSDLDSCLFDHFQQVQTDLIRTLRCFCEQLCIQIICLDYNIKLFMKENGRRERWTEQLKGQFGSTTSTKTLQLACASKKAGATKKNLRQLFALVTSGRGKEQWVIDLSNKMMGFFQTKSLEIEAVEELFGMAQKWRRFCAEREIANKIATIKRAIRISNLNAESTLVALKAHALFFRNLCLGKNYLFRSVFAECLRRLVETYHWLHCLQNYPNIVQEFRTLLTNLRDLSVINLILEEVEDNEEGYDQIEFQEHQWTTLSNFCHHLFEACLNYERFALQVLEVEEDEENVFGSDHVDDTLSTFGEETNDETDETVTIVDITALKGASVVRFNSVKSTCSEFIQFLAKAQLSPIMLDTFNGWYTSILKVSTDVQSFSHEKIDKDRIDLDTLSEGGQKKGRGVTWSRAQLEAVIDGYNKHGHDWIKVAESCRDLFGDDGDDRRETLNKLVQKKVSELKKRQRVEATEEEARNARQRFS
jgi:hypothetical protein